MEPVSLRKATNLYRSEANMKRMSIAQERVCAKEAVEGLEKVAAGGGLCRKIETS